MKKTLQIIITTFTLTLGAQIPNGGFEQWSTISNLGKSYPGPHAYFTENIIAALDNSTVFPASQVTDKHSGNYAIKLTSMITGTGTTKDTLMGLLMCTKDSSTFFPSTIGLPYSGHPNNFMGYYKFPQTMPEPGSSGIQIILTKWNTTSQQEDEVAIASFTPASNINTYTYFSVPFTWLLSSQIPDTLQIVAGASGLGQSGNVYIGNSLYLDDLAFDVATGIQFLDSDKGIILYPNPAHDVLNLALNKNEGHMKFVITDVVGKELFSDEINGKQYTLSLSGFERGIYFGTVYDKNKQAILTEKIIKE